jgi:hypothetical protein
MHENITVNPINMYNKYMLIKKYMKYIKNKIYQKEIFFSQNVTGWFIKVHSFSKDSVSMFRRNESSGKNFCFPNWRKNN